MVSVDLYTHIGVGTARRRDQAKPRPLIQASEGVAFASQFSKRIGWCKDEQQHPGCLVVEPLLP